VATDPYDFPELARLGALMADLLPLTAPGKPAAAPAPRATPRAAPPRAARPNRARRPTKLGAVALAAFADAVNWTNDLNHRSPLARASGPRLGAITLAAFAAGANWGNAPDGPRLAVASADTPADAPPDSIETFLDEFKWD
jgi:hypothetical protein